MLFVSRLSDQFALLFIMFEQNSWFKLKLAARFLPFFGSSTLWIRSAVDFDAVSLVVPSRGQMTIKWLYD